MRPPLLSPHNLTPEQKRLYADMREGIQKNFKGFTAIAPTGELIGPWNPWLRFSNRSSSICVARMRRLSPARTLRDQG
jgi:hypothetical protein